MWDPPQPGIEPTHPAVGSMESSTTGWPGKSTAYLNLKLPKFLLVSFFCNIPTVTLTFLRIFLLVIFFPYRNLQFCEVWIPLIRSIPTHHSHPKDKCLLHKNFLLFPQAKISFFISTLASSLNVLTPSKPSSSPLHTGGTEILLYLLICQLIWGRQLIEII